MLVDKRIDRNDIAGSAGTLPAKSLEKPKGWYSRGYIPHFDVPEILQFITFRLHDSVPEEKIQEWKLELKSLPSKERENKLRSQILKYIDNGAGACYLKDPRVASLVEEMLFHDDGERYRLLNWVVMPNHVHVLIEMKQVSLERILHTWKSLSANRANKILQRQGEFWYRDFYDRYIRDNDHWSNVLNYIEGNPVKARLCAYSKDWRWSSAWRREHESA
jgi:REP element-mobilizing transposase RayT